MIMIIFVIDEWNLRGEWQKWKHFFSQKKNTGHTQGAKYYDDDDVNKTKRKFLFNISIFFNSKWYYHES